MMRKRLRGAQKGVGTYLGTRKGRVVLVLIAVLFMTVGFRASGLFSTYLSGTDYDLIYQTELLATAGSVSIEDGTVLTEVDTHDIYIVFLMISADLDDGTACLVLDVDDSIVATGIFDHLLTAIDGDQVDIEYFKIDAGNVYKGEHTYYIQFGEELTGTTYTFSIIGDDTSPVYILPGDDNGDDNGGEIPVIPTVTHPDDINYTAGTLNNKIVWIVQDDNPSWVEVFRDDVRLLNVAWVVDSSTITVDIDGLSAGDYTYKIVGTDMDGNEVEDVVTVTVSGVAALEDIPIEYILIGGVVFIVLIGGRRD